MQQTISYRGPDEISELLLEDLHLGVVRLAIMDPSKGQQPAVGCGGHVVSGYNGELYNARELRADLIARDHPIPNHCDSALLPHLWEEYGSDMLEHMRGMFAFALLDIRERRLLLGRDRVGIKPLYWAQTPDYLIFASEIKAILATGLVESRIDPRALDDLFSLSYPCAPRTMFEGIHELRPGHFASVRFGRRVEATQRYWRAPFPHAGEHRRISRRDAEHELREALTRKVEDHLLSDVPVATYLSGGLDSSAISALTAKVRGEAPVTFSIGFDSAAHDETDFAARMARHLGSENHRVECGPETARLFPKMIWHTELPLQFPLALPLMQLASRAREKGFPVVLTGEGADELMGGYDAFRADKMRRIFDRPGLRRLRPAFYRRLYSWHGLPEGTVERMIALQQRPPSQIERAFGGVYPPWYPMWNTLDVEREALLAPDGRDVRSAAVAPDEFGELVREDIAELHPLDAGLALELETRLPSWILLIGDRASMSAGVEARVPFLDQEIVELIASLPPRFKMSGFGEKSILRGAMKGLLPEPIRKRRKRPFYTPIQSWFFSPEAPEFARALLEPAAVRDAGLFDAQVVLRLRKQLEGAPQGSLLQVQLEWMLVLVLGAQVLHEQFVRPGRVGSEIVW